MSDPWKRQPADPYYYPPSHNPPPYNYQNYPPSYMPPPYPQHQGNGQYYPPHQPIHQPPPPYFHPMSLNPGSLSAQPFPGPPDQQKPILEEKKEAPLVKEDDTKEELSKEIDLTDPQYRKIFVGGLPHNLQLSEFKTYFQQYGFLEDCVILKDKRTQKPRGFGFVTYSDIESVSRVMAMKDDHVIQGKWVDCKSAIPVSEMKILSQRLKDITGEPKKDEQLDSPQKEEKQAEEPKKLLASKPEPFYPQNYGEPYPPHAGYQQLPPYPQYPQYQQYPQQQLHPQSKQPPPHGLPRGPPQDPRFDHSQQFGQGDRFDQSRYPQYPPPYGYPYYPPYYPQEPPPSHEGAFMGGPPHLRYQQRAPEEPPFVDQTKRFQDYSAIQNQSECDITVENSFMYDDKKKETKTPVKKALESNEKKNSVNSFNRKIEQLDNEYDQSMAHSSSRVEKQDTSHEFSLLRLQIEETTRPQGLQVSQDANPRDNNSVEVAIKTAVNNHLGEETTQDAQKLIKENYKQLQSDSNNVEWQAHEVKNNYFGGFMTSTNDQLMGHMNKISHTNDTLNQQSLDNQACLEMAQSVRQFHLDQFINSDSLLKTVKKHQVELEQQQEDEKQSSSKEGLNQSVDQSLNASQFVNQSFYPISDPKQSPYTHFTASYLAPINQPFQSQAFYFCNPGQNHAHLMVQDPMEDQIAPLVDVSSSDEEEEPRMAIYKPYRWVLNKSYNSDTEFVYGRYLQKLHQDSFANTFSELLGSIPDSMIRSRCRSVSDVRSLSPIQSASNLKKESALSSFVPSPEKSESKRDCDTIIQRKFKKASLDLLLVPFQEKKVKPIPKKPILAMPENHQQPKLPKKKEEANRGMLAQDRLLHQVNKKQ